ncbi:MAG TPA: hypothetical protein VMR90_01130 [Candidatus Cybelea sp.]|nr:hypothetical protein [Candidatus Cybelea sp.]
MDIRRISEALPAAERQHLSTCANCQEAVEDLLAVRKIFKGVASVAETGRPWFTTRVMAAIAAREGELTERASTWLAVPKFASRLALASAALLLVASVWLYDRPLPALNQQASVLAAQESLFEPPPPANQEDVLVPLPENNR